MESLKIALATDWFFPSYGGIEYHVHDLALRLVQLGHDAHVITRVGSFPDEKLPYPVHRFKGEFNSDRLHISMGPSLLKAVNELYKRERFDITHAHSIYSPLAVGVANLSTGIRGVPSIITDHSLLNKSLASPVYRLILRYPLGKVNAFIAVSSAVKKDLEKILGRRLRGRPIYVIPNAIDTEFWRPSSEKPLDLGENVVVTTSRLTKKKRVMEIPQIAEEVLERTNAVFYVIGDGPLRGKLEREIRRRGIEDSVVLTGYLPREEVRKYLWSADVYFSPTRDEAFGIAVLEAMSVGLPVVAYNSGGVKELVENGESGFLVNSDEEIAEKIIRLLEDESLRKRMGRKARRSVEGRFSWDVVVKEILEAYRKTIEDFNPNYYLLYKVHQRILGGRVL